MNSRIPPLKRLSRVEARRVVKERLLRERIDWKSVDTNASQIILFGSWSCGLQNENSDVDVLCVGSGSQIKNRTVEILWLSDLEIESREWLGSELANHVAAFGVWIKGSDDWRLRTWNSPETLSTKFDVIAKRCRSLQKRWPLLSLSFRKRQAARLREDVIRLECILKEIAIPPTRLLESFISAIGVSVKDIREHLRSQLSDRDVKWVVDIIGPIPLQGLDKNAISDAKKWLAKSINRDKNAPHLSSPCN